jgi:tetratricopeptide (TPR) repeat protein
MWQQYCSCLHAYRDVLDGHTARALPVMTAAIDTLIARGFRRLITLFVVACADALIAEQRTREAAIRLNDAMEYCERHGEFVFLPELWRALGKVAHAEALMRASAADPFDDKLADATHCFTKAIELARDQGARMWELRATLALSALLRDEGRSAEAHAMLEAMTPHFDVSARAADIQTLFATVEAQRSSCARRIINTPLATRRRNARYIEVSFERVVSG